MDKEIDSGLVNFDDDQDDDLDVSPNLDRFRDAVLYGTDWTVRTLLQQIEDGNIDLSPSFQRRDAWSVRNKSRFIESVALQLPIPQIVLAERKEQRGTYIVLDGKQRLLTLAQFAGELTDDHWIWDESSRPNHLKLSGLKVLEALNGKTYADIASDPQFSQLRTQFDNHTIRSALIRNWPDEDYLYEVFIRLNTGSARLSPQELRQAMKPGEFTEFLSRRSGESKVLQEILGISGPDFRMRDVDLLLRLIAFQTRLDSYRGNLKLFLDETHDFFNSNWAESEGLVNTLFETIEDGLEFLAKALGDKRYVGRRWVNGHFDAPINRAILDVQIWSALEPEVRAAVSAGHLDIKMAFIEMSDQSQEFTQAVSSTTKSLSAVRSRYTVWLKKIEESSGCAVKMPRLPDAKQ
jgi:hypothetical protein